MPVTRRTKTTSPTHQSTNCQAHRRSDRVAKAREKGSHPRYSSFPSIFDDFDEQEEIIDDDVEVESDSDDIILIAPLPEGVRRNQQELEASTAPATLVGPSHSTMSGSFQSPDISSPRIDVAQQLRSIADTITQDANRDAIKINHLEETNKSLQDKLEGVIKENAVHDGHLKSDLERVKTELEALKEQKKLDDAECVTRAQNTKWKEDEWQSKEKKLYKEIEELEKQVKEEKEEREKEKKAFLAAMAVFQGGSAST